MKKTKVIITLLAAAFIAAGVFGRCAAQEAANPTASIDLWKVRENFKTMIQIGDKGEEGWQQKLGVLIDETLHLMRGPLPGAQTYAFATAKRSDSDEPVEMATVKVDEIYESGKYQKVSAEIATPYELEIFAPSQRAFFKNNGDTFIKSYKVELIIDGVKKTVERDFNDWVHRGSAEKIPLPGIAQWARIEIECAVNKTDVNHTYVKLQARVPEFVDDPRNPYSFTIKELKVARDYNAMESKRKTVVDKLKSALQGLDYVPTTAGAAAQPQSVDKGALAQRLEYILYMLDGKGEDEKEAKKALQDLIDEMKK